MRAITHNLYDRTSDEINDQIADEIGLLPAKLIEHPDRTTMYVNGIERLRGQYTTVRYLERAFIGIENWAVSQNWTKEQVLLALYDEALTLALAEPDDTGSSRTNDGQRSFNDGRRDVLRKVAHRLSNDEWFPGNKNNTSKEN